MPLFDEAGTYTGTAEAIPPSQPPAQTPAAPNTSPLAQLIVPGSPPAPSLPTTTSTDTYDPPEEDLGALDYAGDMLKGAANGAISAVQETGQFVWDVADFATGDALLDDTAPGYAFAEELKQHTRTTAGKLTEGIVNFGVGFVGAGKFLKAAKLLQGTSKAALMGRGFTAGSMADAIAIDPLEDRLSNLVESFPSLSNPLTEALAARPDDSRWEGRLKNACEGVVAGAAAELLIAGVKGLRGLSHAKGADEQIKVLDEVVPQMEAAQAKLDGTHVEASPAKLNGTQPEAILKPDSLPTPGAPAKEAVISPAPKASPIDVEQLWKDVQANAKTPEELLKRVPETLNLNRLSIVSEQGMKAHDELCRRVFKETTLGQGQKTLEELTGAGLTHMKDAGFDLRKIEATMSSVHGNSTAAQTAREELFILRSTYDTVAQEVTRQGEKLLQHGGTPEEAATHQVLVQLMSDLYLTAKNAGTEAARTLTSLRRVTQAYEGMFDGGRFASTQAIENSIKKGKLQDPDKWLKLLQDANFADAAGKPGALTRFAEAVTSKKTGDYFTEWYYNSILSGPRTHLTNTISNAVKMGFTPLERVVGHLMPGRTFSLERARQEALAFSALSKHVSASWQYAVKAFKEDKTILEGGATVWVEGGAEKTAKAFSRENVRGRYVKTQLEKGVPLQEAINIPAWTDLRASLADAVGKVINIPSRFLTAEDEFFKQLNYRTETELRIQQEALERFGTEDTRAIAEYVAERTEGLFDASGRGMDKEGLTYAKRQTWTTELPEGSISKGIQNLTNAHPTIKLIIPFVRTPTNLLYDAVAHTPLLQRVTTQYKEAAKKGGREMAEMKGKAAFGGLLIAGTATLAANGTITGSSPPDPKLREALQRTGWQENSFRIGDTYYSFNRGDPFAILMTTTANFVAAAPLLSEGQYMEMGGTLLAATLRLMGDKSYMKSMGDLVDAAQGDERALANLARGVGAGFVAPSLLRETRKWTDDIVRDVNSVWSGIANSLPGFSETLPPKHDWLTGKPWLPSLMGEVNSDVVARELAVLGGVYRNPPYKFNRVPLSEEQHSRYCELIGTIRLDGKTLHQSLKAAIHSPEYDLSRKGTRDDSLREKRLNNIIESYRKYAGHALLREEAALKVAVAAEKKNPSKKPQLIPGVPKAHSETKLSPEQTQAMKGLKELIK